MIKKIFLLAIKFVLINSVIYAQDPIKHWSFDKFPFINDNVNNFKLDTLRDKGKFKLSEGFKNTGIDLLNNNSLVFTNCLGEIKNQVTISFSFKGQSFRYQSYPKPWFLIQFGYSYLEFNTSSINNGVTSTDFWRIDLKGAGLNSYDFYSDGNWHEFYFIIDLKAGYKRIFIDGISPINFCKKIEKGGEIIKSDFDGFRNTNYIDELLFYNYPLKEKQIKDKLKFKSINGSIENLIKLTNKNIIDPFEFAPGYPNYDVAAINQLKSFPDPRFSQHTLLPRNFPWMDITYLHRELKGKGGKGFGDSNPTNAIRMSMELYDRWNYYYEIPVLKNYRTSLDEIYSDINTVPGALIDFAKKNPRLKTSSVTLLTQSNPKHAGFNLSSPFLTSQKLESHYYLRDKNQYPIKAKGKFWLSPLAPLDIAYKDAQTTVFYLRNVQNFLGRPIDMINENGEYFGHIRNQNLFELDPRVKIDFFKRSLNIYDYNGWFQNRLDTAYKNEIIRNLNWPQVKFTFYNVAAIQPEYWPSYSFRRTSNYVIGKNHFSTPNFYPAKPENWRVNSGPLNGYGIIADGRKREIELGDKLFAPFVSAGWGIEEENIRPAQWLALLKAMIMLGAEYFHVGYFNVTGTSGWANGVGPNDPRGYIYQIALPAYAQAIGSRIFDYLEKGILLNPQKEKQSSVYSFRFQGNRENQLILVRKLDNSYIIYGSIQPISNIAGNIPEEDSARIFLNGMNIKFTIRKQGSIYYFNPSENGKTVFFQLDSWHESKHPYYWKQEMKFEAENLEDFPNFLNKIFTENKNNAGFDFVQFDTFLKLTTNDSVTYSVNLKEDDFYNFDIKLKGQGTIGIQSDSALEKIDINLNNWEIKNIKLKGSSKKIKIFCLQGNVSIDNFIIK